VRTPLNVLLVEDREDDADLTIRSLRSGGYEPFVKRVECAADFLAALAEREWSVILADYTMPSFSALEAVKLVVERGVQTPLFIVSGTIGEEAAVSAMRAGARDCIRKSNLTQLAAAIERELREAEARREANRRRHEAEEKYRTLVELIPAVTYIVTVGETLTPIFASPQIEAFTGYTQAEWLSEPNIWERVLHPEDREAVLAQIYACQSEDRPFIGEYRILARDGRFVWVHDEGRWLRDPDTGAAALHGFAVDVTDRKLAEATIRHAVLHDALTGLPNRKALCDRIDAEIEAAEAASKPLSLVRVSLDHFRNIDNTLGRHNGDIVLIEIARRLSALTGAQMVSRLGEADFAILAFGKDAEGARGMVKSAGRILREPVVVDGLPIEAGPIFGIAVFPGHGENSELLLRHADIAVDCARRDIDGSALYTAEQDPYDPRRLLLMSELRLAIESDQLRLEYQPKIDLQTKCMVGVEALVRWKHAELGDIRPDEFVAIAEESALIRSLTRWVLNAAFRQCRAWRLEGLEICVAVNISARNLGDPDLFDQIDSLLETWGISPEWVVLELTEGAVMAKPSASLVLDRLSKRGLQISIDDFGTGYSSLAYLRKLPVSEVKIDRSFVIGLSSNQGDLTIVRTIIDLGHHLGLRVVAEGVEDARTWELLADAGCDLAQGYFMARPMTPADFSRWVAKGDYGVDVIAKDPVDDA